MQASLAERFIQMRRHGLQLTLYLAGRDDQPIRIIGAACHIQDDDVFRLVVFQAFPRGFHKYFQPVRCKFFAAFAAGARDARRCGLCCAIGLGGRLCLGGGLGSSTLWRCLGRSGRFRGGLGLGCGGLRFRADFGRGSRLRRSGGAPLRAFFSRGGLAGYGRLLSLDTSRVQGCRPDRSGRGSMFPRGDETPTGRARSPLRAGKQRSGGATVPPQHGSRRAMQGAPGPARTGQHSKRG